MGSRWKDLERQADEGLVESIMQGLQVGWLALHFVC